MSHITAPASTSTSTSTSNSIEIKPPTGKRQRSTEGRRGRRIKHHKPLPKGLACEPCRTRKVRCDGALPACKACVRSARFRKQEIQCQYLGEDTAKSRESSASQVSSPTSPVDTLQVDSPAPSTSSVSTAQRVPTPPQAVNNAVPALSPRPWTSAPEGYIVYAVPFNFSHQLDPPLSIPWTFIPSQPQSSIPFSSAFMHELASATSAPFVPFPAPASPRINPPATTSPLMTQSNCLTGILNSHVTNEDLAATLPEFSEPVSSESHQRISVDRFNSSPTDGSTSQTPYDDPSTTTTFGAGSFDLERPEFSFDSFTLEDDATPTKDAMNRGGADV